MGDLNGHVGTNRASFENCLGYFSIVDINEEGQRIFSVRNGLKVMSTYFQHKDNYKFTWYGWNSTMQSEYNKPPEPRNGASTTNHSNHTTERVQQTSGDDVDQKCQQHFTKLLKRPLDTNSVAK